MSDTITSSNFSTKDPETGAKVYGEKAEEIFLKRREEYLKNPPKHEAFDINDAKLEVTAAQNTAAQNNAFKARVVTAVVSDPLFRQNLMTALAELEASRKKLVGVDAVQHFDDSLNALMEIIGVKRD